jgi:hypothetical protein
VQVLDLLLGAALSMSLTYGLVRFDRLRIPPAWSQRGWNAATTGAAIFTFAPLCIVAHFWVTRRSAFGLAQGFGALLLLLVAQLALSLLYDQAGLPSLVLLLVLQPAGLAIVLPVALLPALIP